MDGIDAAVIDTDGHGYVRDVAFATTPYDDDFRAAMRACLNKPERDEICLRVEQDLTIRHVEAVLKLINQFNLNKQDIDIIGFHGQTIHHDPDNGLTVQLGDGALLAQETGIDVVFDLRSADMENGGQGAPLLPVYHRALALQSDVDLPVAIVNIGGVGNITWIGTDGEMVAFDTGPGNAMIDDWVKKHMGESYDANGRLAAQGVVNEGIIDRFLSLPYFSKKYPKSLDRNDFNKLNIKSLSVENGAATLTEMTVQSVALAVTQCPQKPTAIYVTGGGRHNDFMMKRLYDVSGIAVHSVDELGWRGDAMEAEGFAYMAVRRLLNEPISFPTTTGCSAPTVGGQYVITKDKAA